MSKNPLDLLLEKAKMHGYEYEFSRDSQNQWQIVFSKSNQNYWQIKQIKKSNEWLILLLGKPQMILSTGQVLKLLDKHLYSNVGDELILNAKN